MRQVLVVDDVLGEEATFDLSAARTGWYSSGVMEDAVTIKISLDGTVYSFGSAPFRGSMGTSLIVDMARYGSGNNYRLLRSDGSIAQCTGSCLWL